MKRSEINYIIQESLAFADQMNFILPPFARWSADDWKSKGSEYDELRENMLGWDITDFGSGCFTDVGLLMFTIRNGNFTNKNYKKTYAEKLLISQVGQVTPFHFHYKKMEDIINRGGGVLAVQLYNSDENLEMTDTPVSVSMDGRNFKMPAGSIIRVMPGESITLSCGCYHSFWAEKSKVLIGEVSKVNDDRVDNHFYETVGRFPEIEEDVPADYLLSMDYPDFMNFTDRIDEKERCCASV